jgi:hypothetical protein
MNLHLCLYVRVPQGLSLQPRPNCLLASTANWHIGCGRLLFLCVRGRATNWGSPRICMYVHLCTRWDWESRKKKESLNLNASKIYL